MNRPGTDRGFSLLEALVTLLVLSVGLLGLGRLQARLWRDSAELRTNADAFLLAGNALETAPVDWLVQSPAAELPGLAGHRYAVTLTQSESPSPADSLLITRLAFSWRQRSATRSLALSASRNTAIQPRDALWLLPTP